MAHVPIEAVPLGFHSGHGIMGAALLISTVGWRCVLAVLVSMTSEDSQYEHVLGSSSAITVVPSMSLHTAKYTSVQSSSDTTIYTLVAYYFLQEILTPIEGVPGETLKLSSFSVGNEGQV